jgi:hypothetical protein
MIFVSRRETDDDGRREDEITSSSSQEGADITERRGRRGRVARDNRGEEKGIRVQNSHKRSKSLIVPEQLCNRSRTRITDLVAGEAVQWEKMYQC